MIQSPTDDEFLLSLNIIMSFMIKGTVDFIKSIDFNKLFKLME